MADLVRLTRVELVKLSKHRLTWGALLALLLITGLRIHNLYTRVRDEPGVAAKVDEYMQAQVEAWGAWDMGAAVLVAQEGENLVSKGYGFSNREQETPITPDTIFPLASITKPFTALAIMQLQEAGRLSVDDPIGVYFPAYAHGDEITIHHLLTHSSGIPNTQGPIPDGLNFEPGTKAEYSNSNYILLGRIVEQASGQSYAAYVQEHIFEPLGMRNSGYDPQSVADRPNWAVGYGRGAEGPVAVAYDPAEVTGGAGALYSSAADLVRWERALRTEQLVDQNTLNQMWTPFQKGWGFDLGFGTQYGIGYGWIVGEAFGRPMVAHGGIMNGMAGAIVRFTGDEDVAIIVLSNSDWAPVSRIVVDLAAIVFGEAYTLPTRRASTVIDLDPAVFDAYVGDYEAAGMYSSPMSFTVLREGERFLMRIRDQAGGEGSITMALYPESETHFFTDLAGDTEVSFVAGETGEVNAGEYNRLVITRAGQEIASARRRGAPGSAETPAAEGAAGAPAALALASSFSHKVLPKDYRQAATLPGVFEQVRLSSDWLIVAVILLGVIAVGQEFTWGTLRAVLARGVHRRDLLLAKFMALATVTASYLLIQWLTCAILGLLTTRSLTGRLDLSFVDGTFCLVQLDALARSWFVVLAFIAFTLAINVWAGRPGPAFSVLSLGYLLSLTAYVSLPILTFGFAHLLGLDVTALGKPMWGKWLVFLVPHYNSRLVLHWAGPPRISELDHWVRDAAEAAHLPLDPWLAVAVLLLCGLISLLGAIHLFKHKEMTA